jgi:2-aminobenzoate-CoA ligase
LSADVYPATSIPPEWLVPAASQPDYRDLAGVEIDPICSVADRILGDQLDDGRGDDLAIVDAATASGYTFAELDRESARLARGLVAAGVVPGDRVAFRTPNIPEMAIVALGAWRAGAVVMPTPAQARAEELRYFLDDAGAKVLFACPRGGLCDEVGEAVAGSTVEQVLTFGDGAAEDYEPWESALDDGESTPLPEVPSDAPAVLWHTGGTTGKPKGCYHTHRRYLYGGYSLGQALNIAPGERWAAATPVGHALGFLQHTTFSLLHGATAVTIEDFHKPDSLLRAIERHRVTTFTAITATWARMLDVLAAGEEFDTASLHRGFAMWQSASSAEVFDGWLDRGVELRNNFGSTAFAAWALVPAEGRPIPRASLGPAAPGYEAHAIEVDAEGVEDVPLGTTGQLAVKGPTGLTFWRRPELQARDVRDGWTLHDDLIALDEEGNAAYLGRTDYLISSAGYKIAPGEVEKALGAHPAVAEVGVVGAPDPIRQEVVMAFVVLQDADQGSAEMRGELQNFAKGQISPYKYPRRLEFVEALPRDAVGKVQSKVLAQWARERVEETAS